MHTIISPALRSQQIEHAHNHFTRLVDSHGAAVSALLGLISMSMAERRRDVLATPGNRGPTGVGVFTLLFVSCKPIRRHGQMTITIRHVSLFPPLLLAMF